MQDQPPTTVSIVMSGNNPIVSMPPELSASTSYISPTDNSVKNLKTEQETVLPPSTGVSTQMQTTSQVNFTGVVASATAGVSAGSGINTVAGVGTSVGTSVSAGTGAYTPISSAGHMFSNQPAVSFTPGK